MGDIIDSIDALNKNNSELCSPEEFAFLCVAEKYPTADEFLTEEKESQQPSEETISQQEVTKRILGHVDPEQRLSGLSKEEILTILKIGNRGRIKINYWGSGKSIT